RCRLVLLSILEELGLQERVKAGLQRQPPKAVLGPLVGQFLRMTHYRRDDGLSALGGPRWVVDGEGFLQPTTVADCPSSGLQVQASKQGVDQHLVVHVLQVFRLSRHLYNRRTLPYLTQPRVRRIYAPKLGPDRKRPERLARTSRLSRRSEFRVGPKTCVQTPPGTP